MDSGDLSFDVECAVWPDVMGDVEHEAPVWIRDPANDAAWQAEHRSHDESLLECHRRLLAHVMQLLDAWMVTAMLGGTSAAAHLHCANVFGERPPPTASVPGGPGDGSGSSNDSDDEGSKGAGAPLVSLAPLVVFGGGAAAVRCALEVLGAAAKRHAADETPCPLSEGEVAKALWHDPSFVAPRRGFSVCLSGLADHVSGPLLSATVLAPAVTRMLVRLDLRGLVLTFVGDQAPGNGDDDVDAPSTTAPAAAHPLSVRFGRGGAARLAESAAEARADAVATTLMGALGKGCRCARHLDLSGLFFRLEEQLLGAAAGAEDGGVVTGDGGGGVGDVIRPAATTAVTTTAVTTVGLSDASLGALATGLAQHRNMRKLALGGANQVHHFSLCCLLCGAISRCV